MDFSVARRSARRWTGSCGNRITAIRSAMAAAPTWRWANAFVRRMQSRFGWHTEAADTLPIADLVQGTFASVMAFSDPGDSVILQMPSYPPFRTAIDETGRVLQEDHMRDDGTHFVLDLAALEAATGRVRGGCCSAIRTTRRDAAYSRASWKRLGGSLCGHDLVIMSDEIHADLVYPGHTHIPLASISPEVRRARSRPPRRPRVQYSGLRCGVMHFGTPELKARFCKRIPPKMLGFAGDHWRRCHRRRMGRWQPWCDEVLAILRRNRGLAGERCCTREFSAGGDAAGAGAVFGVDRFFPFATTRAGRQVLPGEGKSGAQPGENFGTKYSNFVRLNFATSPAILEQIVARNAAAVRALR